MPHNRKAVVLLITLLFVLLITLSIGAILENINKSEELLKEQRALYKESMLLQDLLMILQNSQEIEQIADSNATDTMFAFLQTSQQLPLMLGSTQVMLSLASARSKIPINSMREEQIPFFEEYFSRYGVRGEFVEMIQDVLSGVQEDGGYKTAIFQRYPRLYRDGLVSLKMLQVVIAYYKQEYRDDAISKIRFADLFSFDPEASSIDLNFATAQSWELLTGVDAMRAQELASHEEVYSSFDDLGLAQEEKERLQRFQTTFFAPYLLVKVDIIHKNFIQKISFEYDIRAKKGYNFRYEF